MFQKIYAFCSIVIFPFMAYAQNVHTIDSINSLPFEYKLKNASILDSLYLKNASDAHKIQYISGEAESYSNLSLIYYFQGKYDTELQYSLQAITLYERLNDSENLSLQYGELGYRMKKNNMPKAQEYMLKGLRIAEKNKFQKPLLSIYNNYGVLKEMQTQLDSALFYYKKGLVLKEKIKDSTGIPYSLNNIAGIYVLQKKYDTAENLYREALHIREKLNDYFGMIENLSYFGDLYLAKKDFNNAVFYYGKSLEKAKKINSQDLIQYNYKKLSECYEKMGKKDLALDNFKLFTQYKDSLFNLETNNKIAELQIQFDTSNKEKLLLQKEMESKKKNIIILIISSLTFFILLISYLIYRQQKLKHKQQEKEFELKSTIAAIETQNKLQEQRLSISRDLHDNIGAQLTFIISSVDNLQFGNKIQDTKISNQLNKITEFTKYTISELRDTIWAMNHNEFSMEDLKLRIFNFIEKAKSAKENCQFSFQIDDTVENLKVTSLVGINLYRTIQEAVNNAIKYAEAKNIIVEIKNIDNQIITNIFDNGKGFDMEQITLGNGFNNMQKRMNEIGGNIEIKSIIGKGIHIQLILKNTFQ